MGSNRVPGVVVLGKIDERKKKKKIGPTRGARIWEGHIPLTHGIEIQKSCRSSYVIMYNK